MRVRVYQQQRTYTLCTEKERQKKEGTYVAKVTTSTVLFAFFSFFLF